MHHPALRGALLVEHPQHLVVGVAVVDDQGLVEPLGQVDVPAERLHLRRPAVLAGAEVVEPGLPDRAHARRAAPASRSISASAASRVPAAACRGASLGCRATPATSASYRRGGLDRPAGAGQVAADLHDPGHADRGGRGERLVGGQPVAVGDVEVAVVVDDGVRQRLGGRRPLPVAAAAGPLLGGGAAAGRALGHAGRPVDGRDPRRGRAPPAAPAPASGSSG